MNKTLPSNLSEREIEILRLVATGASNKEIAQKLVISPNTVKVHLRNIFEKIGVVSRTEAALYALNKGFYAPPGQPSPAESTISSGNIPAVLSQELSPDLSVEKANKLRNRWIVFLLPFLLLSILFFFGYFRQFLLSSTSFINNQSTPTIFTKWKKLKDLQISRNGLASVAFEGQIYAIGGKNADGVQDITERFNSSIGNWETLAPKPIPVSEIQASVIGGKIFIPGGLSKNGKPTDVFEIYDPLKNSWSQGVNLPQPISGYSLTTFEGVLYLLGGWNGNEYLTSAYKFNPAENNWDLMTPLPTPRAYAGAVVIENTLYIIGGWDGKEVDKSVIALPLSINNPESGQWRRVTEMPDERINFSVTSIADVIYILGGKPAQANRPYVWGYQFSPQSQSWGQLENSPIDENSGFAVALLGPNIHILGGNFDGKDSGQHWLYQALNLIFLPLID